MAVAVTIRNVPNEVRDALAVRAAGAGQSLQEYLRAMLIETASYPSADEVMQRASVRLAASDNRVTTKSILEAKDADRR